jgi:hypothetical protein
MRVTGCPSKLFAPLFETTHRKIPEKQKQKQNCMWLTSIIDYMVQMAQQQKQISHCCAFHYAKSTLKRLGGFR